MLISMKNIYERVFQFERKDKVSIKIIVRFLEFNFEFKSISYGLSKKI